MPPITKIWLFLLKDGHSIMEPAFQDMWHEILALCASYTVEGGESHSLFQSHTNPAQLAMITGFPSLELNMEADNIYAKNFRSRFFELTQHQAMYMVYVSVKDLPLATGAVTLLLSEEELGPDQPGKGGWDRYDPAQHGGFQVDTEPRKKTWVQVVARNEADDLERLGSVQHFNMLMESHVTS